MENQVGVGALLIFGSEDVSEGLQQLLLLTQVLATPLKEVADGLSGLGERWLGCVRWLERSLGHCRHSRERAGLPALEV